MLSPLQPFRVRQQAPLSQLQQVTLRQCYQPVIGTVGLAFYLSLRITRERTVPGAQRSCMLV